MNSTRRQFCRLWGTAGAVVTVSSVWTAAAAEVQELGEATPGTVNQWLDLHGGRGIYANPERLRELQAAVTRMIRSHQQLRAYRLPDDAQPAFTFRRG